MLIKELFAAGAHLGYSRSRNHPSTKRQIFGFKNGGAVLDLEQTITALDRAKDFIRGLGMEGKAILFVGAKDEAKGAVAKAADGLGMPYVALRWLGGTFTNWSQIKSRIERLKFLKGERESGGFEKYTKKERVLLGREIDRLERYLATLASLTALPAALVVVDPEAEKIAVVEARQCGVPVVALANSDCNLATLDFPVVANDGNVRTISLFLDHIAAAYTEGKKLHEQPKSA